MNNFVGCPSCENQSDNVIEFNWIEPDKETVRRFPSLEFVEQLKYGQLYECNKCTQQWFLDLDRLWMNKIPKSMYQTVRDWNSRNLKVSDDNLRILREIQATPPDWYGNLSNIVHVPCECELKSGETLSECQIVFSKKPPLNEDAKWYFADEISRIKPSENALSKEIRLATSCADEVRMGCSPTCVETPEKEPYVLNGIVSFMNVNGFSGKDMKLISDKTRQKINKRKIKPKDYSNDWGSITSVYADWFSNAHDLRLEVPNYIKALRRSDWRSGGILELSKKLRVDKDLLFNIMFGCVVPSKKLEENILLTMFGDKKYKITIS